MNISNMKSSQSANALFLRLEQCMCTCKVCCELSCPTNASGPHDWSAPDVETPAHRCTCSGCKKKQVAHLVMERSMTATRKQAAVIGQQQPASPATRFTCIYFAAAYLPFTCDTGLCFQIGMKNKVLHAFFSPLDLTWSTVLQNQVQRRLTYMQIVCSNSNFSVFPWQWINPCGWVKYKFGINVSLATPTLVWGGTMRPFGVWGDNLMQSNLVWIWSKTCHKKASKNFGSLKNRCENMNHIKYDHKQQSNIK